MKEQLSKRKELLKKEKRTNFPPKKKIISKSITIDSKEDLYMAKKNKKPLKEDIRNKNNMNVLEYKNMKKIKNKSKKNAFKINQKTETGNTLSTLIGLKSNKPRKGAKNAKFLRKSFNSNLTSNLTINKLKKKSKKIKIFF